MMKMSIYPHYKSNEIKRKKEDVPEFRKWQLSGLLE